jgi:hypothetical protein
VSIQTVMWTALPNGLTVAGDRLRLSVLARVPNRRNRKGIPESAES